jgi:hypothetical protein
MRLKDFGPKQGALFELKPRTELSLKQKEALQKGRETRARNIMLKKLPDIDQIENQMPVKDQIPYLQDYNNKTSPHLLEAVSGSYNNKPYFIIRHFVNKKGFLINLPRKTRIFDDKQVFETEYEKEYNKIFE